MGANQQALEYRDYGRYQRLWTTSTRLEASREERKTAVKLLEEEGVCCTYNAFWNLPEVQPQHLHSPDLLHGLYLGLLKHLMDWLDAFLRKYGRQKLFDDVWASIPGYPGFSRPGKPYRQVSQWHGKEMRNLGRIILAALASTLSTRSAKEKDTFERALKCTRGLVDFHLMAQYRSHTRNTLLYMEQYLTDFHRYKDVFLEFRAGRTAQKEATIAVSQLRAEQDEGMEELSLSAGTRRRLAVDERHERNEARIEVLRGRSHFNFVKMHLPQHYRDHVIRYGSLPAYSTELGEAAHKSQMKNPYKLTNRLNYEEQIIAGYTREAAMKMRVKNVAQWVEDGCYSLETVKPLGVQDGDSMNLLLISQLSISLYIV